MSHLRQHVWSIAGVIFAFGPSSGETDELSVRAVRVAPHVWHFDITVRHLDRGWEHYAGTWEVVTPEGRVLEQRILGHGADESERPFTRTLADVQVPPEVPAVMLRADVRSPDGDRTEVYVNLGARGPRAFFSLAAAALKSGRQPQ